MSKKNKGVLLDSKSRHGVSVYEDAKATLMHQALMQDFEELQMETDATRSKLDEANQRKSILAAEVRFLRKRYEYLTKANNMNSSQELNRHALNRAKIATGRVLVPLFHEQKKIKQYSIEKVAPSNAPNDAVLKNSTAAFDLNQDGGRSGKEASLPSRAPAFDLNEISTGDDDFQTNVETVMFEEAKRSCFTRGITNDEQQNDLKMGICRNSGEGSSRVGKRKISWQDPVALRV